MKSEDFENAGQVSEIIEELLDNTPDKKSIDYEEWKNKINNLIDIYHEKCNFVVYKKII